MWTCALCEETYGNEGILDHFRLMHPDVTLQDDETWPDGTPVVHEDADIFWD